MNTVMQEFFSAPFNWLARRTKASPKYYVVAINPSCEVRKYRPFVTVETIVRGNSRDCLEIGRERIRRYLRGENTKSLTIDSSGVRWISQAEVAGRTVEGAWVLSQALPDGVSLSSAPGPLNGNLKLRRIPALLVASFRAAKGPGPQKVLQEFIRVKKAMARYPEYQMISAPRLAEEVSEGYLRMLGRNEVHVTAKMMRSIH